MKREVEIIDAAPSKRIFHSIMADYDLARSLCELIDNGLDVWVRVGKKKDIRILVTLDRVQQRICVEDDAGGLPQAELSYIVAPGQTGTEPADQTIGIFGVGTKRAVVALAQDIKITTRHTKSKDTFEIDFDDSWLKSEDWHLPVYQVDSIPAGVTKVELTRLRIELDDTSERQIVEHLQSTYAKFLTDGRVSITVNRTNVAPKFFENWAYPPQYGPREYVGPLSLEEGRVVKVRATAGLSLESSPSTGEYGAYFYCNERLIARGMKSFEVGFMRGLAGQPHAKVSLVRVIVELDGDARDMPWNSSKSAINTKHPVFEALHDWLVSVTKDYAALSRIWVGEWPDKVFKYTSGKVERIAINDFPAVKKSYLPPLPKSRPRYGDVIAQKNKNIIKTKPWARGLYEGVVAADLISKQKFEQRNRIAFVVLDSTLEIGFKDFLVNESGHPYSDKRLFELFRNRSDVHSEIKRYVALDVDTWKKIEFFYRLRNKLVHEKADAGITDTQVREYRVVVETILSKLFKLKFARG